MKTKPLVPSLVKNTIDSYLDILRVDNFPPRGEWVMTKDSYGNPLSYYRDNIWDYSQLERLARFNFARHNITPMNLETVKQGMFLVIYHPSLFPGQFSSCDAYFYCLIKIAKVCDKHGILMSNLYRFPRVFQAIAEALKGHSLRVYINFLHRLNLSGEAYGFSLVDEKFMQYLTYQYEKWEPVQTPYIPPRIWNYQLQRLEECIDDFLTKRHEIETAFNWISEAYKHNLAIQPQIVGIQSPFGAKGLLIKKRITFEGDFDQFLSDYQLHDLFRKWLGPKKKSGVREFTRYLNMVRDASLLYILNFSLQRVGEVMSLRSDCFISEIDERLGEINLIIGETTKTDPDDDARWIVPNNVKKGVDAAAFIASLRIQHSKFKTNIKFINTTSLPLSLSAIEPWASTRHSLLNDFGEPICQLRYGPFVDNYPQIFDLSETSITEDDWKIALSMTPNLEMNSKFTAGIPWQFSAHQLRRTTCVNMLVSNQVSVKSLQWSMKHLSRNMTLYYARNYSRLKLNSDAEALFLIESYKSIYRELNNVVKDQATNVRPHGRDLIPSNVVNLINNKEEKQLTNLIKNGQTSCRKTLLGFCMKEGPCEYGGIESIVMCTNGDGGAICMEAIFSTKNKNQLLKLKDLHESKLKQLAPSNQRYKALSLEIKAIGVYLNAIK